MSTTTLWSGDVIDTVAGISLGPSTITVRGDTVESVRPGHIGDVAAIVDLRDSTIVPGLIDAHVHLNLRADGRPPQETAAEPEGVLVATTVANARTAVLAGVTTVRDIGSVARTTFDARDGAAASGLIMPLMLLAGPPMTITGGHCWFFGGEADGVEGVRQRVRELIRDGSDWIKVMATGGGTPGSNVWLPSYTQPELDAIVDEAHRRNRKVTMHALSAGGMEMAVTAGADHIEHAGFATDGSGGSHFDSRVADLMAASGVVVTPTLSVRSFIRDHFAATGGTSEQIDAWQRRFDNGMEQFSGLVAAGVRFAAGTDAGWHHTPFDGLAEEIALIAECGPSTADALRSATSDTADHFGLGLLGRIADGTHADLVAVGGNPLEDLRRLGDVRYVMRAGRAAV